MKLTFYKYQGAGNDFILIDNRNNEIQLSDESVARLCDRHFGIGADGLMLLGAAPHADFSMRYYNSDGRESTMCGNGGRCITAFAAHLGIARNEYKFLAIDGLHVSQLVQSSDRENMVRLQMNDVNDIEQYGSDYFLNTGSPHVVRFVADVQTMDVFAEGRAVRYSELYQPGGANVNFVQRDGNKLYVRTYERGVENETLACGTGATASAIATTMAEDSRSYGVFSWDITTPGGMLNVVFSRHGNNFTNVFLTGPAVQVFKGEICL